VEAAKVTAFTWWDYAKPSELTDTTESDQAKIWAQDLANKNATITFSNRSFYSHKKSRTQSPKSLQKTGALNYQNKQQNK